METAPGSNAVDGRSQAYSRAAIDEFLVAADAERARLREAIAVDEDRTRRARAAIGADRVMCAMLLEAQNEIDEIRSRAEAEAARILAATESLVPPLPSRDEAVVDPTVLGAEAGLVESSDGSSRTPTHQTGATPGERDGIATDGSEEYFEFLRGALVDDEPLGPRPE